MSRSTALCTLAALLGALALGTPARAEAAGGRHQAWQSCLANAFTLRAALSGRALAVEAALRECRDDEAAYLAALSVSPLLDEEDVARVRPALVVRARHWLLNGQPSRSL